MALLVVLFLGVSLLLTGLSVPLIRGWVKPNYWYGFRFPLTLTNPDIWYPANRYGGWLLLIYSLVLGAVALGLPLLGGSPAEGPAAGVVGPGIAIYLLAGIALVLVLSWRYAHKLAEDHETDDTP